MKLLTTLAAIATLGVAGCASDAPLQKAEGLREGRVVIVSLMGPRRAVEHIGPTVFDVTSREIDASFYKMDSRLEARAAALLAPGATLIPVAGVDTSAIRVRVERAIFSAEGGFQVQGDKEALFRAARTHKATYVLVVVPAPISPISEVGYGTREWGGTLQLAAMQVELLDAQDESRVATAGGRAMQPWRGPGSGDPKDSIPALAEGLLADLLGKMGLVH